MLNTCEVCGKEIVGEEYPAENDRGKPLILCKACFEPEE